MKRLIALCICAALMHTASAMAAAPATSNRPLDLYAAPGGTELFEIAADASLIAIEAEAVGDTDWTLVEAESEGLPVRGYVRSDGLELQGEIPSAAHAGNMETAVGVEVYAAPSPDAPQRGTTAQWESVRVLCFDGAYVFVEYADSATGNTDRGWMKRGAVSIDASTYYGGRLPPDEPETGSVSASMRCTALTTMYSAPYPDCTTTLIIPADAVVECYGGLYCGFSIVEYNGSVGYMQTALLTII